MPGDARAAAASFPDGAELRSFLTAPPAPDTLARAAEQAEQAEQTVEPLTMILAGREIWRVERGDS